MSRLNPETFVDLQDSLNAAGFVDIGEQLRDVFNGKEVSDILASYPFPSVWLGFILACSRLDIDVSISGSSLQTTVTLFDKSGILAECIFSSVSAH